MNCRHVQNCFLDCLESSRRDSNVYNTREAKLGLGPGPSVLFLFGWPK